MLHYTPLEQLVGRFAHKQTALLCIVPCCRLYGLVQQITVGDNTTERPMWAEKGGLDFEGRARWDAWSAVKGMDAETAKLKFVTLYYEFLPSCLYADTRGGVTA